MRIQIEGEPEIIHVSEPQLAEEIGAAICAQMQRDVIVRDNRGVIQHEFFTIVKLPKQEAETIEEWAKRCLAKMEGR
jgi:hypothetical protein